MIEQKNSYSFSTAAKIRAQKLEDWLNTNQERISSLSSDLSPRRSYKWSQRQDSWFIKS